MERWLFFTFAVLSAPLLIGSAIADEATALTDAQRVAIETHLGHDSIVNKRELHYSDHRFADGVKGNESYFNADGMIHPIEAPFTTRAEQDLFSLYCSEDEIALGRAESSTPYLSASGKFIYTVTQFHIVEVLKSKLGKQPGDTLTGVVFGGELTDAGERLRDTYNGLHRYPDGQLFLLSLYRPIEGSGGVFSMPFQVHVSEPDGTLNLLTSGISGYENAALQSEPNFEAFRSEIGKVAALKECWKPKAPN